MLATVPDSGAVQPGFRAPAEFRFDEVISEQSGGGLDELVLVSPRPEDVEVSWKRNRIEIRPQGGWRAGTVYQVRLLPGVADLRNNRMREGHELIFSTGPEIPATSISGTVINWPAGRLAPRALIEAIAGAGTTDSLVYAAQADSTGDFTLRALPPGEYLLLGTVDENNNQRRDRRDAFDSVRVRLDSTSSHVLWAFVHDTVGPQLREATQTDSVTVRLEFSQHLPPGPPGMDAVAAHLLPDSLTPVALDTVLLPDAWDSLRVREAATRDSLARLADTARADTARADTAGVVARRPGGRAAQRRETPQDTSRATALLRQRGKLVNAWIVRLAAPLVPGSRYRFTARATNVNGAVAQSRTQLVVRDTATAVRR
ncbi:MAG TPA: Ig-like domain-containing protein [Gemmatimonadales bacterium]|nr:Ig-like domain-containing protein [Gemmatimonadales bacterium]